MGSGVGRGEGSLGGWRREEGSKPTTPTLPEMDGGGQTQNKCGLEGKGRRGPKGVLQGGPQRVGPSPRVWGSILNEGLRVLGVWPKNTKRVKLAKVDSAEVGHDRGALWLVMLCADWCRGKVVETATSLFQHALSTKEGIALHMHSRHG